MLEMKHDGFHDGYVGTNLDLKSFTTCVYHFSGSSHTAQVMYGVGPHQKPIKVRFKIYIKIIYCLLCYGPNAN